MIKKTFEVYLSWLDVSALRKTGGILKSTAMHAVFFSLMCKMDHLSRKSSRVDFMKNDEMSML